MVEEFLFFLLLPDEVKDHINTGKLSFGHARALVGMEDAISVANHIMDQSLNVRQTEDFVRQQKNDSSCGSAFVDPEISNLANQISSLIGLKSNVKLRGRGGVVEINFRNFEELDFFVRKLNN